MSTTRINELPAAASVNSGDYLAIDNTSGVSQKITAEQLVNVDPTLSVAGRPADAKATGEAISAEAEARQAVGTKVSGLNGELDSFERAFAVAIPDGKAYTLAIGVGVNPDTGGNYNNAPKYARTTPMIAIPDGGWVQITLNSSEYEYVAWCYSTTNANSGQYSPTDKQYIRGTCFAFNTGSTGNNSNYVRIGIHRVDDTEMDETDETKLGQAFSFYVFDGKTVNEKIADASASATNERRTKYFSMWANEAENIPANSDLNDYISDGGGINTNYKVQTAKIAETIANMPALVAGALKIIELAGASYAMQLYMTQREKHLYVRYCVNYVFTDWKYIASQEDIEAVYSDVYKNPVYNPFGHKPLYDHLFVSRETGIVIPHESVYHIRMSKRFGFDVFEINTVATSDGVYVANHFSDGKFGPYFHHVDGTTDISNVAVSSVTWEWIQTNVRYNSTIPMFRTAPSRLEDALAECKMQGLLPLVQIRDAAMVETIEKIMGKNNYIAYKGTRENCGNAIITEWLSYTTKSEILAACEQYGAPFVYCMSNPTAFSDADLKDIVDTLHANGYLITTAYQDYRWTKYRYFGFDGLAGIRLINRITNGNICNYDSILGYSDFTISNGTQTDAGLYFESAGNITPNIESTTYFASGFDLEIVFDGSIILRAIGEFEADRGYDSDGTYPIILSIPVINGTPKPTIRVLAGTTVKSIIFKASKF